MIHFKGIGEHSVFELEKIIIELQEILHQKQIESQKANTWISVNSVKAPIDTVLLCKVEDYYIIGRFTGNRWVNDSDLSTENVTHWRPIF